MLSWEGLLSVTWAEVIFRVKCLVVTWLWRWLPLRLSKRQSPRPTLPWSENVNEDMYSVVGKMCDSSIHLQTWKSWTLEGCETHSPSARASLHFSRVLKKFPRGYITQHYIRRVFYFFNIALLLTLFPTMKSLNDNKCQSPHPRLCPLPVLRPRPPLLMHRVLQNFYDKTVENLLCLGLTKKRNRLQPTFSSGQQRFLLKLKHNKNRL